MEYQNFPASSDAIYKPDANNKNLKQAAEQG